MKKLAVFALVAAALAPPVVAQTPADFTGKWEGTITFLRPDGTEVDTDPVIFSLMQKGEALTGTIGSDSEKEQWNIDKGAVTADKATFDVQQPNGPLWKVTLTIVKGRLQGEMAIERNGVVRVRGTIDAAKAK
jgi:hypothetical protein